jgi:hypothetical protein
VLLLLLLLVKEEVSGGEVGVLGGVGVGVFAFESILRSVCSAIMRIR